ncbi:MAG: hypothetical protein LQ340_001391 [Diploschistes diacapsis]|nr:MAG: hypothetical protein LQ340_001391 [Diploschistes diacapsis]
MATISLSAPLPSDNTATVTTPSLVAKRDVGTTTVINNCGFDVWLDRVTDVDSGMNIGLPANGGTWSEPYQTREDGGGISVKVNGGGKRDDILISVDCSSIYIATDASNIAQFEYTVNFDSAQVFYDLSLVNGDPFAPYNQGLHPDDQTCTQLACQPGESPCAAAYNSPEENPATHGCGQTANLVYYICGGP